MWTPIDGRILPISDVLPIIAATKFDQGFVPSGGALHNTATPSLRRSQDYSIEHWRDMWVGFYRDTQGWSAGPHFFCFWDKILIFTPLNRKGVHSPSWNGTKFGIEMVADFDIEDDNAGLGLKIKQNAAALFASIYGKLGLDPVGIKLHKEDPRTTHACPGRNIDKAEFIGMVEELMGHAGEHPALTVPPAAPAVRLGTVNVPANDWLSLREMSSASSALMEKLLRGASVEILGEAKNGATPWMRVRAADGKIGWVAARYVAVA